MSRANFPLTATPFGVRADLTPAERTSLEAVRDKLQAALSNLKTTLGDGGSTTAMYARANHMRNTLDGAERKAIEAARDDVSAALTNVRKLLGEPAPTEPAKTQNLDLATVYAALNQREAARR